MSYFLLFRVYGILAQLLCRVRHNVMACLPLRGADAKGVIRGAYGLTHPALLCYPLAVREQWACSYVVFLDDFGLTASTTVEVRHAHWCCWCWCWCWC